MANDSVNVRTVALECEMCRSDPLNLFYIADDPYYDNMGGMSLRLNSCTPTIPAPAAAVLAALGSGFVGWLRRRNTL